MRVPINVSGGSDRKIGLRGWLSKRQRQGCLLAVSALLLAWLAAACAPVPATSPAEAVHAAYLDLSGNISDLRTRVGQWQKGDEDSRKIAEEKIERIEVVLSSVAWPKAMAPAIDKTSAAVAPMARVLKDQDLAAAEPAAKAFGDASHDVTHAFYGDWLPTVSGYHFNPMASHVTYLDLTANISDLQSRVAAWQKGDESSLNIAKEKVERIGVLLPHLSSTGVMVKPLAAVKEGLPSVEAALEQKDGPAVQQALKPIADASLKLTRDSHVWMDVATGGDDAACVQASYLDLSRSMSDLRTGVANWQKGDENGLNVAREKLARVEVLIAHPNWPAAMVPAIDKTKEAVAAMASVLKEKDLAATEPATKAFGDASHDVTHAFYGDWLPAAPLRSDRVATASTSGNAATTAQSGGHGAHGSEPEGAHAAQPSAGPNYWFAGSLVAMIAITIAVIPFLRRRDLAEQRVEVD